MPLVDVRTVVQEFEAKVKTLTKEVSNLEKKKINYEGDIASLSKKHQALVNAVETKSGFLVSEVAKATTSAVEKVKTKELELQHERENLTRDRAKAGELNSELKHKIVATDKLKSNLENSIKEQLSKDKEVKEIKSRLQSVMKIIQENING